MSRSWDSRSTPTPDSNVPSLRGPRRTGPIRGVVPGDSVEEAREIARLWEWHTRLKRVNDKLTKDYNDLVERIGPLIPGYNDYDPSEYPSADFKGGYASFVATLCSPSAAVTLTGDTSVGKYRSNHEAGARLQARIVCAFSDIDQVTIGAAGVASATYNISGGYSSGGLIRSTPWITVTGAGSGLNYDEACDIYLTIHTQLGFSSGAVGDGTIEWRWAAVGDADPTDSINGYLPAQPIDPTAQSVVVWDPTSQTWTSDDALDVTARGDVRVDSTGTVYSRRRLNFIPGSSKLSVAAVDDSGNEEIDLTLDVVPANITITDLGGLSGASTEFLSHAGTWVTAGGARLNGVLYGTPALGTTRYLVVPRGVTDTDVTIDLERLHFRTETPSSSGSIVAVLQKSVGGEAGPTWSDIGTITLTAGEYEADVTIGAYTVTSDDLLRLYFTSVGTGSTDYQALITGTQQ